MDGLRKKPSTSELLDWIKALAIGGVNVDKISSEIPFLGTLLKNELDTGRFVRLSHAQSGGGDFQEKVLTNVYRFLLHSEKKGGARFRHGVDVLHGSHLEGYYESSLNHLYYIGRAFLVKSEAYYDMFDLAFQEYFGGYPDRTVELDKVMEWLENPLNRLPKLSPEEMEEISEDSLKNSGKNMTWKK